MSIETSCMIVNLQVGLWLGHKLDKSKSREVTNDANAADDAARVNKHIIPKESLKFITTAASAVRNHFYDNTLPWKDNGDRLLTRKLYTRFIEDHQRLVGEFYNQVDEFVTNGYPAARARAEFRMGGLWKDEDYPEAGAVRRKFYVNLDLDAVQLPSMLKDVFDDPKALKAAQDAAQAIMQERTTKAVAALWGQLNNTLGHFANKMGSDEIFRDSTVRNLEELIERMDALNFTNDPDLARIATEVKDRITGYDPADLRKDPAVRNEAAADAKKILEDMAGFMAAFGTN